MVYMAMLAEDGLCELLILELAGLIIELVLHYPPPSPGCLFVSLLNLKQSE